MAFNRMLHLLGIILGLFCAGISASVAMNNRQGLELLMVSEMHSEGPYKLSFGDYRMAFQDWKAKFAHVHGENWDEAERFQIFSDNVAKMEHHNWLYHTNKSTFYMGLNQFSAMTNDEYQRHTRQGKYASKRRLAKDNASFKCVELQDDFRQADQTTDVHDIPASLDWAKKGFVTPVKDQGQCGSCWTFSATGAMEGAYFKAHNKLESFSEQQILDCCHLEGCGNCDDGGLVESAFEYAHNAHGIETEQAYPYEAQTSGHCRVSKRKVFGNLTTCYTITPSGSEAALKSACAKYGPISVAIDAALESFQMYSGGVYYDPKCSSDPDSLDHAVLVTGYGTDDKKQDYWIVKNSWNENYGLQGYIWMIRNHGNACGIADDATFPVFK